MNNYSLDKLKNSSAAGLSVLRLPMLGAESVTVLVLAGVGSRQELAGQEGIAHVLEHMVFKGTKKFPSAAAVATTIDGIGADFNAFTSKEYTGFYVRAAASHLELALEVVADLVTQPLLPKPELEREKKVILEEIKMYQDLPSRLVGNEFEKLLFEGILPGSGLEHEVIGSPESVMGVTQDDLKTFMQNWYGPENLLLVVAGKASVVGGESNQVLSLANEMFEQFKGGSGENAGSKSLTKEKSSQKSSQKNRLRLIAKDIQQAHVMLGWPGLSRSAEDRYALAVLNTIIGGNMSSRLFTQVREQRGLAYYVHSETSYYKETGVFGAALGTDPAKLSEAVSVALSEFEKIAKTDVTAGELARAKDYLSGKMKLSHEDSQSVAQGYGTRELLVGEIEPLEEALKKIQQVTLDEVMGVAKKLIVSKNLHLAVVGPEAALQKFEQGQLGQELS